MNKEERNNKLFNIGLIFNGQYFIHKIYDDINIHWTEVACYTNEEFNSICDKIEKEIKRRNTE
jgi:hypothetical protein